MRFISNKYNKNKINYLCFVFFCSINFLIGFKLINIILLLIFSCNRYVNYIFIIILKFIFRIRHIQLTASKFYLFKFIFLFIHEKNFNYKIIFKFFF